MNFGLKAVQTVEYTSNITAYTEYRLNTSRGIFESHVCVLRSVHV